jgi:pimeloyl-ACP methyl ester carboxylesterase
VVIAVETTIVMTPDGREVCVESGGDPAGTTVLVHGGTPNSRHLPAEAIEDAAARGIHLVSYDRPGYGRSTSNPGRQIADCAGDVQAIAAAFGATRIAVWGWSGSGPHASPAGHCCPTSSAPSPPSVPPLRTGRPASTTSRVWASSTSTSSCR